MARARVDEAAAAAGYRLTTARPGDLIGALRGTDPDLVVLDLDAGGLALVAELEEARVAGLGRGRVIGYFSHIDEQLGAAARRAGCEAFPRGRFWRTLPEILGAP
jgi:hypothetical protein